MAPTEQGAKPTRRPRKTAAERQKAKEQHFLTAPDGSRLAFSTFREHIMCVQAPTVHGMGTPQQATSGGVSIKFHDHRAYVPEEHWALFEADPEYVNHKVGYAGDPLLLYRGHSPLETIRDTMTALKPEAKPPIAEWDNMPNDELRELIDSAQFDPTQTMDCMRWEAAHRRRAWVVVALSEYMPDEPAVEVPEAPGPPPEPELDPATMPYEIPVGGGSATQMPAGPVNDGGLFS